MITRDEYKKLREELRNVAQLLYRLLEAEDLEREEIRLEKEEIGILRDIRRELKPKQLSSIKIQFGGNMAQGPVTLSVGQKTTATVLGFDQNGAPFAGAIPAPSFSVDTPAIATVDPVTGLTVAVAAGVANLTATVAGPAGPLTDTETVTVTAVVPVLSSIKVDFSTPA